MKADIKLPERLAEELDVRDALGVSPVGWDTRVLARTAVTLAGRSALDVSVLDMGTGTGYVAIYLALHGIDSVGVDMNPASLCCARQNARRNGADAVFLASDLFENVPGRYDLIVFNPPYGNVGSTRSNRLLELVKSILPKEQPIIRWVAYRLTRAPRVRLVDRFLRECHDYLTAEGRVLILLHESELPLVAGFSVDLIEKQQEFRLLLLKAAGTPPESGSPHSLEAWGARW